MAPMARFIIAPFARLVTALCLSALMGSASANYEYMEVSYAADCPAVEAITMLKSPPSTCTLTTVSTCVALKASNGTVLGSAKTHCTATRPTIPGATGTFEYVKTNYGDSACATNTSVPDPGNLDVGCIDHTKWDGSEFQYMSMEAVRSGSDVTIKVYTSKDCSGTVAETIDDKCDTCVADSDNPGGYKKTTCKATKATGALGGDLGFALSMTPSPFTFFAIATFSAAFLFAA